MKVDIGIIGALSAEVDGIIELLENHTTESFGSIRFHIGLIMNKRVVVAQCGVGKVFAAICAEAMILKYSPSIIVNSGVGGAISPELSTGDMVIADRLCQHDMDTSALGDPKGLVSGINKVFFDSDLRAVQILKDAAKLYSYRTVVGTVASGDKFVASTEDKKRLACDFGAVACEMEGAAVAQTAFVNKTQFVVVRAISDSADGNATMDYPTFMPIAAKNSIALTLALIERY